jgi:ectoine hydroxylase-related dioxygenase (phytanoyl-CoA dioxygenase family)
MGPVIYIDGSHLWPGTDELRNFNSTELAAIEQKHSSSDIPVNKCVIALKKGQVSFHHCRMIHGSDVNHGDGPRRSLALHMQDAGNRYRDFRNNEGVPWRVTNDVLARKDSNGLPDYADPAVFPILWSDRSSGNDR